MEGGGKVGQGREGEGEGVHKHFKAVSSIHRLAFYKINTKRVEEGRGDG